MRKTIIVLVTALALPAYAGESRVPQNYNEYVTLYNHTLSILNARRAPMSHSHCFSEQGYCIVERQTTYNNINSFVGWLDHSNGYSTTEICLSPGNITNERRCFSSTGAVWDETYNGTMWDVTNQISGNWQEGE